MHTDLCSQFVLAIKEVSGFLAGFFGLVLFLVVCLFVEFFCFKEKNTVINRNLRKALKIIS